MLARIAQALVKLWKPCKTTYKQYFLQKKCDQATHWYSLKSNYQVPYFVFMFHTLAQFKNCVKISNISHRFWVGSSCHFRTWFVSTMSWRALPSTLCKLLNLVLAGGAPPNSCEVSAGVCHLQVAEQLVHAFAASITSPRSSSLSIGSHTLNVSLISLICLLICLLVFRSLRDWTQGISQISVSQSQLGRDFLRSSAHGQLLIPKIKPSSMETAALQSVAL